MNFDNHKSIRLETTKGKLEQAIVEGVRDCIRVHGDITPAFISSCAKRIIGQLKPFIVEVEKICLCGDNMTLSRSNKDYTFKNRSIKMRNIPTFTCSCGSTRIPADVKRRIAEILQRSNDKRDILQYCDSQE